MHPTSAITQPSENMSIAGVSASFIGAIAAAGLIDGALRKMVDTGLVAFWTGLMDAVAPCGCPCVIDWVLIFLVS